MFLTLQCALLNPSLLRDDKILDINTKKKVEEQEGQVINHQKLTILSKKLKKKNIIKQNKKS